MIRFLKNPYKSRIFGVKKLTVAKLFSSAPRYDRFDNSPYEIVVFVSISDTRKNARHLGKTIEKSSDSILEKTLLIKDFRCGKTSSAKTLFESAPL